MYYSVFAKLADPMPLKSASSKGGEFDAWLLDFDGTLYRHLPVRLAMAAELAMMGIPSIPLIRRFRKEQELLRCEGLAADGKSPYETQIEKTALALNQPIEQVLKVVREWMEQRPGKWLRLFRRRRLLMEIGLFRAQGGKTAIVSDYPAATKLAALRVSGLFDVTIASGEDGGPKTLKPSPEGYLLAAKRLGVTPEQCLVIGDRDDADGEAARRANMAFRLLK